MLLSGFELYSRWVPLKCVMVDVQEFIKLVCSCAICMPYVCFSGDTVWDTEEMLLHGVSGTSTSLNQGWNT